LLFLAEAERVTDGVEGTPILTVKRKQVSILFAYWFATSKA
jgi:hypothetical protein